MSILDHIILFLILFTSFFLMTRINQSTINKYYWHIVLVPIILYSLILGCRYGWGNDYLWYKYRFEHPFGYENESPGFRFINMMIATLGGSYVCAFIVYSLAFIVCVYSLLKLYRDNKYMIFLFLPATLLFSTYTIRQSFAESFVYLAFLFFFKKEWLFMGLMLIVASSIHIAALLPFILYIILYFITSKPFPIKYTIPIYILMFVFTSVFSEIVLQGLNDILPYISLDNKYQGYIDGADRWFNNEAQNSIYEQSSLTSFLMFGFHLSMIYTGYVILRKIPQGTITIFYNMLVISLIFLKLFFELEILRRIAESCVQLYFIPIGFVFYHVFLSYKTPRSMQMKLSKYASWYIIFYLILYFGRFIFLSPHYQFYWNII